MLMQNLHLQLGRMLIIFELQRVMDLVNLERLVESLQLSLAIIPAYIMLTKARKGKKLVAWHTAQ